MTTITLSQDIIDTIAQELILAKEAIEYVVNQEGIDLDDEESIEKGIKKNEDMEGEVEHWRDICTALRAIGR